MMTLCSTALDHQMPLHNVKMTLCSTGLGHHITLQVEVYMSKLVLSESGSLYHLHTFGGMIQKHKQCESSAECLYRTV